MPRKPIPCAICGGSMQNSSKSAPVGTAAHRDCRPVIHGLTRYSRYGCRCDTCRAANTAAMSAYNARRKAKGLRVGPSPESRRRARGNEKAKGYTERLRKRDAARRARKAGALVEQFTHAEIFERDGWMCGICDEPVDRGAAWPDPLSPSLDHIVPLSLGGEHSTANTRCAHLGCNIKRGNRMEAA